MTIPNIFISSMGNPKSGKTHFAYSCPEPIAVLSFDMGAKFVRTKFPDKRIDIFEYPIPVVDTVKPQPWELDLYKQVRKDFDAACQSKEYKTIVLDPATVLWEIIRHAYMREKNYENMPDLKYVEPNARMSYFLMEPLVMGKNLVALSHLRDEYINGEKTGNKEMDGFKRTNNLADIVLLLERRKKEFFGTIMDCRFDPQLNEVEVQNPNYTDLIALLGWS